MLSSQLSKENIPKLSTRNIAPDKQYPTMNPFQGWGKKKLPWKFLLEGWIVLLCGLFALLDCWCNLDVTFVHWQYNTYKSWSDTASQENMKRFFLLIDYFDVQHQGDSHLKASLSILFKGNLWGS